MIKRSAVTSIEGVQKSLDMNYNKAKVLLRAIKDLPRIQEKAIAHHCLTDFMALCQFPGKVVFKDDSDLGYIEFPEHSDDTVTVVWDKRLGTFGIMPVEKLLQIRKKDWNKHPNDLRQSQVYLEDRHYNWLDSQKRGNMSRSTIIRELIDRAMV